MENNILFCNINLFDLKSNIYICNENGEQLEKAGDCSIYDCANKMLNFAHQNKIQEIRVKSPAAYATTLFKQFNQYKNMYFKNNENVRVFVNDLSN